MSSKSCNVCLLCEAPGSGAIVQVGICRDHLALLQRRSLIEAHHPEGRVNSPETVDLPVGIHSVLSAKQTRWPEALRSPSGDPLIQIARRMWALRDFLSWYVSASFRDSGWLLALALEQQEKYGAEWWKNAAVAPLDPGEVQG